MTRERGELWRRRGGGMTHTVFVHHVIICILFCLIRNRSVYGWLSIWHSAFRIQNYFPLTLWSQILFKSSKILLLRLFFLFQLWKKRKRGSVIENMLFQIFLTLRCILRSISGLYSLVNNIKILSTKNINVSITVSLLFIFFLGTANCFKKLLHTCPRESWYAYSLNKIKRRGSDDVECREREREYDLLFILHTRILP